MAKIEQGELQQSDTVKLHGDQVEVVKTPVPEAQVVVPEPELEAVVQRPAPDVRPGPADEVEMVARFPKGRNPSLEGTITYVSGQVRQTAEMFGGVSTD
jgi:hypothetical protein